jgi:hypothetical protein
MKINVKSDYDFGTDICVFIDGECNHASQDQDDDYPGYMVCNKCNLIFEDFGREVDYDEYYNR